MEDSLNGNKEDMLKYGFGWIKKEWKNSEDINKLVLFIVL